MATKKIKKGDKVKVIAGESADKTGKVLQVSDAKIIVEGVNIVSKHTKPRKAQEQGGILKSERPIQASNVMLVCPECGNETRVGFKFDEEGNKYRFCKNSKCLANIDKAALKEEKKAKKTKEAKEPKAKDSKDPKPEKKKKD